MPSRQHSQIRQTDVLVVGGGGAALRAALAAQETDRSLDVTLITKGQLGASGVTATACSDRMAFHATLAHTPPGGPDSWRHHAEDIYAIGGRVSDYDLAEILARNAAQAVAYLQDLGVPWVHRADGAIDQFLTDGSLYPRACYTGPHTANHIEAALLDRLRGTPVHVIEHHMVAQLLLAESGRVVGAAIVSEQNGEVSAFAARSVVLATGGAGRAFASNVFPPDCTGDGYAMAYRAGAELVNLEFIQIGLCSTATKLACSGSMMRSLPRLVDDGGREFLADHMPGSSPQTRAAVFFAKGASWPLSQRDASHQIDVAVAREMLSGRRVFLDYLRNPEGLTAGTLPPTIGEWYEQERGAPLNEEDLISPLARLRAINPPSVDWLAERGIDLSAEGLLEIAPAVQHFQGGIRIRACADTAVRGLFAAGEAAGGQHGANRPGGNALLDSQVFGRIAGESAANAARLSSLDQRIDVEAARRAIGSLFTAAGRSPDEVLTDVQHSMSERCGVCRTTDGLQWLVAHLQQIADVGVSPSGAPLARAVESVNVLQVAQAIALAALSRDESRGPHLRFPTADAAQPLECDDRRWERYIVIRKAAGEPHARALVPVRPQHTGDMRD